MKSYNWKIFSKRLEYKPEEISEKIGYSKRTITENWKNEGLKIKNGKIQGIDLIDFLKYKKFKRKMPTNQRNEFYCFASKKIIKIVFNSALSVDYDKKNNRFILTSKCDKEACTNKYCTKSVKKLTKIISLNEAKEYDYSNKLKFTILAKEELKKIRSKICKNLF